MKKYQFKLNNLDCANCANELEIALQKIDMIEHVSISFIMQRLTFECLEANSDEVLKEVKKVIKNAEVKIEEI